LSAGYEQINLKLKAEALSEGYKRINLKIKALAFIKLML
jgi:hypothetical protein